MMYNFTGVRILSTVRSQQINYCHHHNNSYNGSGPETNTEYGTFSVDFGYDSSNNQAFKQLIDQLAGDNCFDGIFMGFSFKSNVTVIANEIVNEFGPKMVEKKITEMLKDLETKTLEQLLTDIDPLSRLFGILLGKLQQAKITSNEKV